MMLGKCDDAVLASQVPLRAKRRPLVEKIKRAPAAAQLGPVPQSPTLTTCARSRISTPPAPGFAATMSDGSTGPTDDSTSLLTSILRASSASGSSRGLAPKLKASLDLLLLGLRPDEEYAEAGKELDRLAASVPKSSCGRGFQKGDVIWKCKTCAIGDDTCVVCQAPPRIHAGRRTSK